MDLSIIILSYNTKDITNECLNRLQVSVNRCQRKLKNKIEVIVLDNASKDSSAEMIKKNHSWVKLIESKINTGYSKGNNIAFKKTKHEVVLFMNSDVFVEDDSITKALEYFKDKNPDILGIKLTFENGSLQPSAGELPNPLNIIFWILGLGQLYNPFHPKAKEYFSENRQVGWVMGAFFMIKKSVFNQIGGFDERIFMYMDEVDLCKRAQKQGFKVFYTPSVSVVHLHRASSKDNTDKVFALEIKGVSMYLKKYYASYYPIVKIFLIMGLVLRVIAFSLLLKTSRARAYLEGLSYV